MFDSLNRGIRLFVGFVLAMASPLMASAQDNVIDEVIWVVGGEPIFRSDVEMARIEAQSRGTRFDGDPNCVIPEQLALQKLYLHQAAIDSIEVSDSEVMQMVERQIDEYTQMIGSKEKLEEYFGKTTSQIRERLTKSMREVRMTALVQDNLKKGTRVTPALVRKYFKELPEDSIPFIPTQMEVQILVREPYVSQEEIDRVKDELRSYTERINNGSTSFSSLAVLYSEDRGSASQGGEIGFQTRADLAPEFAAVAFNLTDPKTVSKIVETEYGFHIIQLIEKRGERVNCRHILRKPRVSDAAIEKSVADLDSIVALVNRNEYSFEEAVANCSFDKETRNNNGLMTQRTRESESLPTSKFELKDLPSEVAKVVAGMKVGEISKPFVMINDKNKEVVAVVKLKTRTNGHRATMKDDYQTLQNVVVNRLNEEKIEKWIREMQQKTYVSINENWRNCEFKYPGWIK
jgi:peptidyl-prolyl cis-trans isomerase SurA